MKRIAYSFLLFLALSPACGFAQGNVMFGVIGGIDLGGHLPDPYLDGMNVGGLVGIEIGYFGWDNFSYSVQLLFDQKGYKYYSGTTLVLNYFEIPVTIKIPFTYNKSKPYFYAGPAFGYLLSGATNNLPSLDFEFDFGFGFTTPLAKNADIFFEGGFAIGLTDHGSTAYIDSIPFYHSQFSLDTRICFGILWGK